jgi:iron complex outermembrane recepter protein
MYPRRFLLIGTAMLASPSYAQVDAPGANDVGPEIIVTANKREQKLSDVGATVAVLGGEALARQQISDLAVTGPHRVVRVDC